MKLTKLAVAMAIGMAALAAPVYADGPDDRALYEMLLKSSMMRSKGVVTKSEFLKTMEQRFDAIDKNRRGRLTAEEIKALLDAAQP
jgi:hypothetical protein